MTPSDAPAARKAIIPAAGRGTRLRPASQVVPKELFPLGTRPAIELVIEEATRAGLLDVAVVINRRKELIRRYLATLREQQEFASLRVEILYQEEPVGLADAISLGRDFAAGEPFAVLLPDNVLLSPRHRLSELISAARGSGRDAIGVLALDHSHSGQYGNCGRIEHQEVRPGLLRITRLLDKRPGALRIEPGEILYRACGRYVCQPHVFEYIERCRSRARGELDDVPVFQAIIREHGALGRVLTPPLFDVGNPRGYLAANSYLFRSAGSGARSRR
jgi:UTP--glucose-1-phosphate uridylyltransferase